MGHKARPTRLDTLSTVGDLHACLSRMTAITGQGVASGREYPIGTLNPITEPKMKEINYT